MLFVETGECRRLLPSSAVGLAAVTQFYRAACIRVRPFRIDKDTKPDGKHTEPSRHVWPVVGPPSPPQSGYISRQARQA